MNLQTFLFSPSFLYIFIWTTTIWLQSLQILDFYKPINWEFIKIQTIVCLILLISEFFFKSYYRSDNQDAKKKYETLENLYSFCRKLFLLLLVMFAIDALYSGGLPLFWLISRNGLTHADFGIPTFHGTFHGILLFFTTSSFFLFLQGVHKKESFIHVMFLFFYATLSFNRGIVLIFLVQAIYIYLLIFRKKINLRSIVFLILFSLFFIWIFGVLGDFRTGYNTFARNISSEWNDFFNFFPKNLLWFYNYSTTGLNNLYGNIPHIDPNYTPCYTFARLIPTVVYNFLEIPQLRAFTLVDGRATICTSFEGLISDFGLIGILFYLPIIILAQISYYKALKNSFFSIILYGILMQSITMTVFIDTIFYLPFLLQIFLLFCFFYKQKIKEFYKKSLLIIKQHRYNHAKN
jgi:oligosaccharide repeat unit polymerase